MAWLRSYLFEATYRWIVDHGMTPYLLVDSSYQGVVVPVSPEMEGDQLILTLAPTAIRDLVIDAEGIFFDASFSGEPFGVSVPHAAVVSLYSKESGQGLYSDEEQGGSFGIFVNELDDETLQPEPVSESKENADAKAKISERLAKSGLKVVK